VRCLELPLPLHVSPSRMPVAAVRATPVRKGKARQRERLVSIYFFLRRRDIYFIEGCVKGEEGSWLGASNSRKCHNEDYGSRLSMQAALARRSMGGPSSFCVEKNCKCLCGRLVSLRLPPSKEERGRRRHQVSCLDLKGGGHY